MDSDPISSSPVKRQKLPGGGYRTIGRPQDGSSQSLRQTAPTQTQKQAPRRPQADLTFANLMDELTAGSAPQHHITQPTQPLPQQRSTNNPIQVARSSPAPAPDSPSSQHRYQPTPQQRSQFRGASQGQALGARFAPPGTTFRRPAGVKQPRPLESIVIDDDDDFVDPPIDRSSDNEGPHNTQSAIPSTSFTKGGRNLDSSPNRVQDTPKSSTEKFRDLTSSFAYDNSRPRNVAGDMASAYGGVSRNKSQPRQAGPSRAQPLQDMTLDDIFEVDLSKKVERMQPVLPGKPIRLLYKALKQCHGNFDDAVNWVFEQDEPMDVVDLTSSDIESNAAKPSAKPKPAAKQQVKAPSRTIADKYSNKPMAATSAADDSTKPRRRLMQGRKNPISPAASPSPVKPAALPAKKRAVTVIDSDDSEAEAGKEDSDEEDDTDFDGRFLKFLNACSVQDLAELCIEKKEVAEFILSKRPFRSLDAIRNISDALPLKSGKKSTRKAVGERVLDMGEKMYRGYEAVDELVEKCDNLGKPIAETMKQWGVDVAAAAKEGELALTNLDDTPPHDSGIGTPSSSTSVPNVDDEDDEDDIVKPKARPTKVKKSTFLKQPANMNPDLAMKDYQLFGLNWLNLLWSRKLSCILADDMGLGKTCQVISFLAHLKETQTPGVHLIVVPGSTLENWLRELDRFCPALNVHPYYGTQNEREEQRHLFESTLDEIDVLVTTYETAVGKYDTEFLRKVVRPTVCVFDEGHALKNSSSKRHQQLMRIPAEFRLLLTGTPLQNNLQELASLLSFILPNLFNSRREDLDSIFKYKATTKDADHGALLSHQRIQRARSMMTPFILRRKKQQVLRHMPAKHRRVEYCDMLSEQQGIYNDMVKQALEARAQPQKGGKGLKVAQEMTALRFAALHPLLLRRHYTNKELEKLQKALQRSDEFGDNRPDRIWKYLNDEVKGGDFGMHRFCVERDYLSRFVLHNEEWMKSGKVQKLQELLESYVKNGDKVLIFSQFTTMMDILESVFETLSIKFMRLDGSTAMSTRQDIIDQFSTDKSIPVFMLSTKAGGAGINLACANKVIIFDSSFNPQDDIQAENRAHRVGQTRDVEVVRLISRGTIEEQIHALGESKLALDDRVAGAAEDSAAEKKIEADAALMVEDMFFKNLEKGTQEKGAKTEEAAEGSTAASDKKLSDEFRDGLKDAGLDVGSN